MYSLLPYHAVADELRAGKLAMASVNDPPIRQATFVDTTRKHPLSNAARAVFSIVLEEMRALDAIVRAGSLSSLAARRQNQ